MVIAILAAIALPSYQNSVVNSRRGTAAACLTEMAQFMERYYTTRQTYVGAALPLRSECRDDLAPFYTIALVGTPDATSYLLRATPQGVQATRDTRCGALSVNQLGTRTFSVATASVRECW